MAIDTPATIAIIGAGPIGLEAALYARFLGYDVRIYERDRVAGSLFRDTGHEKRRWRECISPLGIAALAAQQPDWRPPEPDALVTGNELAELYFVPLAHSDLLADHLRLGQEVIGIERDLAPGEVVADDEVAGFRLRLQGPAGETVETADVVIDASGAVPPADAAKLLFGALVAAAESPPAATATSPARLLSAEADYYILGAKSAAASQEFRIVDGLAQIRDLFTIVADRAALDLYANTARIV